MHVERPEFKGLRRIVKSVFDRSAATFGILLIAPVLIGLAVAIKVSSCGPVFFRHERIGMGGQPFHVLKFRSMVPDADKVIDLLIDQSEGNAVQFKMKRDPRVTRVGAVMRRYSFDELPQLFNVLGGSMSLVGPRPHVTREWSSTASTWPAACWSSPASPASGRSAAAPTSPGTTRCASTSGTWRTGR
jgi:lipopolysaccharide/colanic/teichoic acid biosynthesis glycosyltransferase